MKRLRVGLTGGIGSGKSTVARIFQTLKIPVYYADDRAKSLMTDNVELRQQISDLFGPEAYDENGALNRAFLASRVFTDKELLGQLEALVHPAVFEDSIRWHEEQTSPYTLKEAALLFESGSAEDLDYIIVVTAPEEERLRRVTGRDGITEEAVRDRMRNQWSQEEKDRRADFLINNDGAHPLIPQVLAVHRSILELQKKQNP